MLFFFAVCHREMRVTKKDFLMSNSPNWPTAKFSVPHVCVCVCVCGRGLEKRLEMREN